MNEREQSLAMMIRRLVSSLKRHEPDSRTAAQAVDLLKRYGLLGSPLRTGKGDWAQQEGRNDA